MCIYNLIVSGGKVTKDEISTVGTDIPSGETNKQKAVQDLNGSAFVGACDPDDRLRATEGCFLMTDMADVESMAEPTNNGKVVSTYQHLPFGFKN